MDWVCERRRRKRRRRLRFKQSSRQPEIMAIKIKTIKLIESK
jgi:hypothetical protein